jgi:glyoxylase-like metal-dependent hydrolase (beta-lactamase superfamily II)
MAEPVEIARGVFIFTSSVFSMNSALVLPDDAGGAHSGLLVDPGVLPAEVDALAAFMERRGGRARRILLTHSDWDHVSGASRFPDAHVIVSSEFPALAFSRNEQIRAEVLHADALARQVRQPPFAIPRPGSLVGSESQILGSPRPARAFPTPGHTRDGLALLLTGEAILFSGDYLSPHEIPFVEDSFADYRRTLARFRRLLGSGAISTVVPGHGSVLGAEDALRVLDEDQVYLDRLLDTVAATVSAGGTPEQAAAAALNVAPPRAGEAPEIRTGHGRNAERAAAALQK